MVQYKKIFLKHTVHKVLKNVSNKHIYILNIGLELTKCGIIILQCKTYIQITNKVKAG